MLSKYRVTRTPFHARLLSSWRITISQIQELISIYLSKVSFKSSLTRISRKPLWTVHAELLAVVSTLAVQKWVQHPFLVMYANANAIADSSVWTESYISNPVFFRSTRVFMVDLAYPSGFWSWWDVHWLHWHADHQFVLQKIWN